MKKIIIKNVTAKISTNSFLRDISLEINNKENWAVIGANGAGKSSMGRLISDDLEIVSGAAEYTVKSEYISFEKVIEVLEAEDEKDESDYMGGGGYVGTTAREFMCDGGPVAENLLHNLAEKFNFTDILGQELRTLSTGEMRKVSICRALLRKPDVLVLDEPFDGLDSDSCSILKEVLSNCVEDGVMIVLLLNRFSEILPQITHIAYLKDCTLFASGEKNKILESAALRRFHSFHYTLPAHLPAYENSNDPVFTRDKPVIEMKNVRVRYGDKPVFNNLDWTVMSGQNWMIVGPNGSGKTTLLNLVIGDNMQAYGNDIYLFGRKKGSGESVWEIKKKLGYVSTSFQQRYRVGVTAKSVIISGFFDSIGVYRKYSKKQEDIALQWLSILRMEKQKNISFHRLSYGEQRMLLIARAMVKRPTILILDEPCQGLDDANREMVLKLIDHLGKSAKTQLLYVSHHVEDKIPCISHVLQLSCTVGGGGTVSAS